MKKLFYFVLPLFVLISCSSSQKETVTEEPVEEGDPFLTSYFEIVDALTKEDFEQVQEAGLKMYNTESTHGVALALTRLGRLIVEAPTIQKQREVLLQMGEVMPLYIEQNVSNDFPIYKFRCSTTSGEKEEVWFSMKKDVVNPYSGKKDLCIELVETIEPIIRD